MNTPAASANRMLRGLDGTTATAIMVAAMITLPAGGQSVPVPAAHGSQRPAFEVASIKPSNNCVGDHQDEQFSPGRLSVTCIRLANLVQAAYGAFANGPNSNATRPRLYGLPEWANTSQYDIVAKAAADSPMDQMFGPMLQVLLEDRFQLRLHRETRQLPVYAMTLAKGGLKIQPTKEGTCVPVDLNHPNERAPNWCGRMTGRANGKVVVDDAYGMTMAELANRFLTNRLDRPVIDRTGISGLFDAHLEFARQTSPVVSSDASEPSDSAPSIFTAVQEQLGLKLETSQGPVEVLVVDHVEGPSGN